MTDIRKFFSVLSTKPFIEHYLKQEIKPYLKKQKLKKIRQKYRLIAVKETTF